MKVKLKSIWRLPGLLLLLLNIFVAIVQLSPQVNDDLLLDPHVVLQIPDPPQLIRGQFLAVKDLAGLSQLQQRVEGRGGSDVAWLRPDWFTPGLDIV